MKKKQTLGEMSLLARQKEDETLDPREQGGWMMQDFEKNILEALERGKKALPKQDFFLVVLQKIERLMQNVLRNQFFYRISCPTPNYDQIVYHYDVKNDSLKLLWSLPNRDVCFDILENRHNLDPELYELLGYILDFKDETLAKKAMKLNKEDELINNLTIAIKS